MLDYATLVFLPSELATSALLLAMLSHRQCQHWDDLTHLSGYSPARLQSCVSSLLKLHQMASWPDSQAVLELLLPVHAKFSQECWCFVAHTVPLESLPSCWFEE